MCVQDELPVEIKADLSYPVMSVLSSMRYCLSDPNDTSSLWFAFAFIPFGLFFDLFDGKVARWRKKSSLMGQELDSLADLVGITMNVARNVSNAHTLGHFRHSNSCCWICNRLPHNCGSDVFELLRPLWADEVSPVQCDSCNATEGRNWQVKVLRGYADSVRLLDVVLGNGHMDVAWLNTRQNTHGDYVIGISVGVSSCGNDVLHQRMFDGQPDSTCSKAVMMCAENGQPDAMH